MLRLAVAVLMLALAAGCGVPAPGPAAPAMADIAGSWAGRVDVPGAPLDVGVTLIGTPAALAGTVDVPAQGVVASPLASVAVDGATVRFTMPGLRGDASFAGTLAADGSALGGEFVQAGARHPLVMLRRTAP